MNYHEFPREEIENRLKKCRRTMEQYGIDALCLTLPENIAYFSGMRSTMMAPTYLPRILLVPREEEITLMASSMLEGLSKKMSWIKDENIKLWGGATHLGYPQNHIKLISKTLEDLGLAEAAIGVEFGNYDLRLEISQMDFEAIKSRLPRVKWLNAADVIWKTRMIKSSLEIDCIRKACEITCEAYEEGFKILKEGMSERELANVIYDKMVEEAYEVPFLGFLHIRGGSERYLMSLSRPSNYKLKRGDLVIIDGGVTYKGYWSDTMRMASIGKPTKKQKEMFKAALNANNEGVAAIKPGMKASDIHASAIRVIEEEGLTKKRRGVGIGHGLGLAVHEPPIIAPTSNVIIEPGMILTVEPSLYDIPEYKSGVFIVEEDVLVTERGHEVLTPISKELYIV